MFPEFDRRLDRLLAVLADPAAGSEARKLALAEVDAILLAMRQVLGRMIELEDFNEAVELLKTIIQSEQKLRETRKSGTRRSSASCWRSEYDEASSLVWHSPAWHAVTSLVWHAVTRRSRGSAWKRGPLGLSSAKH